MTVWTRLMIILALVSTVQWLNSTAQHTKDNNSYWEGYLRSSARNRPKRTRFFGQDTTATIANKSSYKVTKITNNIHEIQRMSISIQDEPVINIKNINVRDLPPENLTKSLFTNENTTNNTKMQHRTGKKLAKIKMSPLIFPNNKFIPNPQVIEKCSPDDTFCVKVDNYPRQDLSNLFRTSKYVSTSYFGTDTLTYDIQTRISNSNLETLCESKVEVIFPEAGITKTDEWHYIIQDLNINDTNFRQGIRVEKCINRDAKCKFNDDLPFGYTTTCVQKYIYKKLVAIKGSKEIYYESFKLPSCCECMYSKTTDISTRFNQKLTEASKIDNYVFNKKN